MKALLFDLDNTLVPEMPNYERAFAEATADAARREGFAVAALRAAVFGEAAERWMTSPVADYCLRLGLGSPTSLLTDFPGPGAELTFLRDWSPTYRRESWLAGLARVGVSRASVAVELDAAFRACLRARCVAYEDALPMLEQVASRYALAVTTNGPEDVQDIKLRASGLRPFFPVLVVSTAIGSGKPEPAIFFAALERMGIAADEALVVGDNLENDVAGAHAAGMRCVWVNRAHVPRTGDPPAYEINSLAELPLVLPA